MPFDDVHGTIANDRGRVSGLSGVYVAGWIKRGPSGVIGTNKKCAKETVDLIFEDHATGRLREPIADNDELVGLLDGAASFAGWEAIDLHERSLGEPHGRHGSSSSATTSCTLARAPPSK